jgi:hypothetical protein
VERVLHGSNAERDAFGLVVALHEAAHAYGVGNEAKADCYAVQLVPLAARALGIGRARADRLGRVAVTHVRETAPEGYWDGSRCKPGGAWDLPGIGTSLA